MTTGRLIALICILLNVGMPVHAAEARSKVQGVVYWDKNNNGVRDKGETGIGGVCVSNGKEVVKTNKNGTYKLPAYDEMVVFVIKPSGYAPPVNEKNIPQFFYIHQPKGSPPEIKKYPGIEPTGDLPRKVNFALLKVDESEDFKAIIIGDTQVYTHKEIEYLRNSIVKELVGTDVPFVISMGDNVGDVLSLYPRYLSVMSQIGTPLYLVPGNHDMNYDAEDPSHAFETFKREFEPIYYSFNYGRVHFVVLNDVYYPSPQYSEPDKKTYHGEIDAQQMEWLKNDLSHVSYDHLIVLNMHIPVVSFCDRNSEQHMVANREALYVLLKDHKALTLSGHTHTLEHFLPGEQEEGWGQATPIHQIIVGAACGSWWTGDFDEMGVPMAYQRFGAPRGYMIFEFSGNNYIDQYKAAGKHISKQMNCSFLTQSFTGWYAKLASWLKMDKEERPKEPPVTLHDLPDQYTLSTKELSETKFVANVWNGSKASIVTVQFDDRQPVIAQRTKDVCDPFALRLQSFVFRYAMSDTKGELEAPQPLSEWMHTTSSNHIWTCNVPEDLNIGAHHVKVLTTDMHGNQYRETMVFEIVE